MEDRIENPESDCYTFEVSVNTEAAKNVADLIYKIQDTLEGMFSMEGGIVTVKVRKQTLEEGGNSIALQNVNRVILPPAPIEVQQGFGFGDYKKKEVIPRRYHLYNLLHEEQLDENLSDTSGILNEGMMREQSYHLLEIPKIGKQVLVCDEEGQATFISDAVFPIDFYAEKNKLDLKELPEFHRVLFRDLASWRFEVRALLTGKGMKELVMKRQKKLRQLLFAFMTQPEFETRGESYYECAEKVTYDLEKYAEAIGISKIEQLNSVNMKGVVIACSNGERVEGLKYLKNAAKAFGYSHWSYYQMCYKLRPTLRSLKKIAGVELKPERDKSYYSDENLRKDFLSFAEAAGLNSFTEFTTTHLSRLEARISTGEVVKFRTYLSNAAIALELARSAEHAASQMAYILLILQQVQY